MSPGGAADQSVSKACTLPRRANTADGHLGARAGGCECPTAGGAPARSFRMCAPDGTWRSAPRVAIDGPPAASRRRVLWSRETAHLTPQSRAYRRHDDCAFRACDTSRCVAAVLWRQFRAVTGTTSSRRHSTGVTAKDVAPFGTGGGMRARYVPSRDRLPYPRRSLGTFRRLASRRGSRADRVSGHRGGSWTSNIFCAPSI